MRHNTSFDPRIDINLRDQEIEDHLSEVKHQYGLILEAYGLENHPAFSQDLGTFDDDIIYQSESVGYDEDKAFDCACLTFEVTMENHNFFDIYFVPDGFGDHDYIDCFTNLDINREANCFSHPICKLELFTRLFHTTHG